MYVFVCACKVMYVFVCAGVSTHTEPALAPVHLSGYYLDSGTPVTGVPALRLLRPSGYCGTPVTGVPALRLLRHSGYWSAGTPVTAAPRLLECLRNNVWVCAGVHMHAEHVVVIHL